VSTCEHFLCKKVVPYGQSRCEGHQEVTPQRPRDIDLRPSSEPTNTLDLTPQYHTNRRARAFKCPDCGGEFDEWEEMLTNQGEREVCPFCGTEKFGYGESDGEETNTEED